MKLFIFKNTKSAESTIPFVMSVSLVDEVIPPKNSFLIPIYAEGHDPGKQIFSVEICGFKLEAETQDDLLLPTSQLLSGLINSYAASAK